MDPFGDRVPKWPPLAGVAAMLSAIAIVSFVPLVAALPAILTGGLRAQPGIVLVGAAGSAVAIVATVFAIARLTRPVSADQLGLRAPDDVPRALALALAAALVLAGATAAWALLGDLRDQLVIPPELDTRGAIARAHDLPVRESVEWGPGLLVSALARCVLPVVAGEILLRGFVFPALSSWRGPVPAALIVSILFGGLGQLFGAPGIAVLSMLLGLGLCGLYLATGSLLPGVAIAAAAAAAGLGVACALAPAGSAALAAGCAVAAVGLAAVPALRVGEARRPQLA
jgi:membrane protease YdiL (CAAX protease family)